MIGVFLLKTLFQTGKFCHQSPNENIFGHYGVVLWSLHVFRPILLWPTIQKLKKARKAGERGLQLWVPSVMWELLRWNIFVCLWGVMCWVELARLWGGWWNISVVIFVMDGPTDQPILLLQDTDEADWSSSYLVNFSSRLLTIISSSRILSSFSVLATGDLVSFLNSHRSSFLGCSNLTWTHQRRSRVWILLANVSVPEHKEGLPPKKTFPTNRVKGWSVNTLFPWGKLNHAALWKMKSDSTRYQKIPLYGNPTFTCKSFQT